jgi:D-psicose/D-tagatose/L-ribulose 3-epimerase
MELGLINSAWVQAGRETVWGIRQTKAIGFDSIDIFADPLDIDARERRSIRRECESLSLPIISVACVAVGLVDFNASVRRFHMERVRAYLDLCHELDAKNLLLVLGEYIWQREVIPAAEQWQYAVECLKSLGDHAATLDLEIVLELEPFKLSLINDVNTMVAMLDAVDHPRVRANIDISHLHLAGVAAGELRRLAGRAGHVHISDCNGIVHGDLPPGHGVVEFEPYLAEIAALGINGAISIELEYSPEPEKIVEWVREAYTKTDGLLKAAGIPRGNAESPR